ncbi:MAG: hypothetical protein HY316_05300 [Acidobacteria bacterium]|nr:hypothetical protein [Acidobacteriota bacterium]
MEQPRSSLMAVDVALIPPEWVQERARRINRKLLSGELQLDATHVPHVSLAQLFVLRATVPLLIERLGLALSRPRAMQLRALAVVDQQSTISFLLDRTEELLELHEGLMDALKEWEEEGGDADAFYSDGEPARKKDVEWVTSFRTAASYRKFIPHLTLGFGQAPDRIEPFEFVADHVGLYHLGRFCSCRILLHSWRLC